MSRFFTWNIYLQVAGSGKPRKPYARIMAASQQQALEKASVWFEVPLADLVAIRSELDPNWKEPEEENNHDEP